jgi:hypothetical protein
MPKGYDSLDGVQQATIQIHGKLYTFPIGSDESGRDRSNDVYYLKKAMKGDEDAMDIFLGGRSERLFFIGRENPLWLKVSRSNIEVVE